MDLVVDANILFAALIRDSTTSTMLFDDRLHLFAPEYLLIEFEKYRNVILKKTNRSDEEFNEVLDLFQRRIFFVPSEEISDFIEPALAITPDMKDVPYIALALCRHISIWSNDKKLKTCLGEVQVYSTHDLLTLIYG